jgi:hypothetical protein
VDAIARDLLVCKVAPLRALARRRHVRAVVVVVGTEQGGGGRGVAARGVNRDRMSCNFINIWMYFFVAGPYLTRARLPACLPTGNERLLWGWIGSYPNQPTLLMKE